MADLVPQVSIESRIHTIRAKKIMLDKDLAELYEVTTGNLNKAVKRNIERFPEDFMFQLSNEEAEALRFQFGSLKQGKHFKYLPYAFTENGVAMLSGVLNSVRAVQVNIQIMRAFTRMRNLIADNADVRRAIEMLERRVGDHDKAIEIAFNTLRGLMEPRPEAPRPYSPDEEKRMGFTKGKK